MILFLGPPGAGKSVQAKLLEDEGAVRWLSVGRLLRERLTGDSRQEMKKGQLVDDSITFEYLEKEFDSLPLEPPILVDGFPRRVSQVDWLEEYIDRSPRKLRKIVVINLDREEIINRLTKRGREDDSLEVIDERLKIYHGVVEPVIDRFASDDIPLVEVDGHGTVEEVHERILKEI